MGFITSYKTSDHSIVFSINDGTAQLFVHYVLSSDEHPVTAQGRFDHADDFRIGAPCYLRAWPRYIIAPDGSPTVVLTVNRLPHPIDRSHLPHHLFNASLTTRILSSLTIYVRVSSLSPNPFSPSLLSN